MQALLIDKLNDYTCDIIQLIGDNETKYGLTDEHIEDIKKELLVHSFDELVRKFDPSLYMTIDLNRCNVQVSRNALNLPGEFKIPICQESGLFQMLIMLLQDIHAGKYALYTNDDLMEGIWTWPSLSESDFINKRECIFKLIEQGELDQAESCMNNLFRKYDQVLFLIYRFIQNFNNKLKKRQDNDKYIRRFILETDQYDQLKTIAYSERFKGNKFHCTCVETVYKKMLHDVLYHNDKKYQNISLLEWNMQIDCLRLTEDERHDIETCHATYQDIYEKVLKCYWGAVKPLFQTLLNCYFFLQKERQDNSLMISNCTIEELIHSKNLESFQTFLNTTNNKSYLDNRIQYAILPNIRREDNKDILRRIRFQTGVKENTNFILNEEEDAARLRSILSDHKIETHCYLYTDGKKLSDDLFGEFTIEGNWLNKEQRELYQWMDELMLQNS